MLRQILISFSLCLMCLLPIQSKVLWVGRNIDLEPNSTKSSHSMLKGLGHSYLVIIPDKANKLRRISPLYAKYEKNLGCGHKGLVIGAYPQRGSSWLSNLDGWLDAQINAKREEKPTRDYLCGTRAQKGLWNFVGGQVHSSLSDEAFINLLITNTLNYITSSKSRPVDYHAFRSVLESVFSDSNSYVNNCNAFAFSLLAWSEASDAPDIGARRCMPGSRKLLVRSLFDGNRHQLRDASKDQRPTLVKNDNLYRQRVAAQEVIRAHMMSQDFLQPIIW